MHVQTYPCLLYIVYVVSSNFRYFDLLIFFIHNSTSDSNVLPTANNAFCIVFLHNDASVRFTISLIEFRLLFCFCNDKITVIRFLPIDVPSIPTCGVSTLADALMYNVVYVFSFWNMWNIN